jgi:hypothetical protein
LKSERQAAADANAALTKAETDLGQVRGEAARLKDDLELAEKQAAGDRELAAEEQKRTYQQVRPNRYCEI